MTQSIENVVGDMALAGASVVYAGPFTPAFRTLLRDRWRMTMASVSLPYTEGCTLVSLLVDAVRLRRWQVRVGEGLHMSLRAKEIRGG